MESGKNDINIDKSWYSDSAFLKITVLNFAIKFWFDGDLVLEVPQIEHFLIVSLRLERY